LLQSADDRYAWLNNTVCVCEDTFDRAASRSFVRSGARQAGIRARTSVLTAAVDLAWTTFGLQVSRVSPHTNDIDNSSALPNYLKRGFVVVEKVFT
jgi:hypothetical protein